ncbi:TetR family transcriptional regulator [Hydrogenophaga sp. H7]|uniref:TetR/AcrR family transcriptional regulator n=1 Tax=Hydrogenophaga sp. H7 TaxID=1882399 RepID=UPI00117B9B57
MLSAAAARPRSSSLAPLASNAARSLNPRRTPRQARSAFTLDAIFEATIQLLVADGMHRLTTTKVAERAGVSVGTMYQYFPHKEARIDTYWRAKMERADVTRALYRSVAELDNQAMIDAFASRANAATSAMLASASDATFTDLRNVNLTLVTVVFGAVRNAFERNLRPTEARKLRRQLVVMCRAYLESVARPSA